MKNNIENNIDNEPIINESIAEPSARVPYGYRDILTDIDMYDMLEEQSSLTSTEETEGDELNSESNTDNHGRRLDN